MGRLYKDTNNFIVLLKLEDVYVDLIKDFETRIDTSNSKVELI